METQNDPQRAACQKQEEQHRERMANDFDYMCMHATRGRLTVSLFPQDYESLTRFENVFRHVMFEFHPTKLRRLRLWYQKQGFSAGSAEKMVVVRLLGRVMDECENRGFEWPRSLLKVKSDLIREATEERRLQRENEEGKTVAKAETRSHTREA